MDLGTRTAALWAGIVFCIVMLAMTVAVVAEIEIEEWKFGTFLLVAFIIGGVVIIGMIMLALISALRHPPDE
jgi:hypothetical protein